MTPERWRQVDRLLGAALEREPSRRAAFLAQACGEDEALRREVEALLAAHERAGSRFLEAPALDGVAEELIGEQPASFVGQRVGRYEVLSALGAGGMGEVYLATDPRLGRRIALKLLPSALAQDRERRARFEQEARAAAQLAHPNVCVIHEVGETEDGRPFIAMEYVEGETLRVRMARSRMAMGEALAVAQQVAAALGAAHALGIVHRDIKPENIMLRPDGYTKVVDFGLAKLIEQREAVELEGTTRALVRTAPDVVMGTVAYMSPEQVRAQALDARTDLWSLGVVLYEMVTGRHPFAGETAADLMASILQTEPAPLSVVAPEAPEELARIVGRALSKPLDGRYQTAAELRAALAALGDVSAHAVERSVRLPVGAREEILSTSLVVEQQRMAVANNLPQQLTSFVGRPREIAAEPSPSIAVLAFVNMSADPENEYFCDGLATELLNALAKIKALRVAARTSAFYFKGKNTDVHEIGQKLNVDVVLEGIVRKAGNRVRITVQLVNVADGYHLWSEQYDREMEDVLDLQDEISLAIVDVLKVKLLGAERAAVMKRYTGNAEAYQLYLKGRYFWYKFPGPGYEKAREYFQQSIDSDPKYALGFCGLADYFGMAAALSLMPPDEGWLKCAAAMEKALALDGTLADVYNTKAGISFYYDRDWPAAERAFKHAIELNPNFAEVHHHYGLCLMSYGRTDEALAEIGRGLRLDPLSIHRNLWQGRVYFWLGWYEKAIEQYVRTLDLDGNFALAHKWLGAAYEQTGRHVEAIGAWSRALVLQGSGELAALVDDTFATAGFEGAVRALALRRLERLNERRQRGEYVPAMAFVTLYQRLGDGEQTTAWLAKAVRERNRPVLEISVDPRYRSLRRDPNWAELARTMGFPDPVQRSV